MSASRAIPVEAPRDRWRDACGASVFLSFVLIVAHVVGPHALEVALPYAGGGAVILGIGATVCLGFKSRQSRLAASVALLGLMGLRALSAMMPGLLVAEHGALSLTDGGALILLILAAVTMLGLASSRTSSGPGSTQQPTSARSGARG